MIAKVESPLVHMDIYGYHCTQYNHWKMGEIRICEWIISLEIIIPLFIQNKSLLQWFCETSKEYWYWWYLM